MNDIAVIIVIFIMCCFLLNGELLLGQQVEYAGVKIEDAGHRKNAATYSDNADERKINDTELTYSGNWEFNHLLPRSNGYFCNTRSFAKSEGASASYLFTDCVGFAWHAMPAPNGTKADLYVDGRKFSSIDCAKVGSDGVLFDSGVLKKGSHTLVIVAVSGAVEIQPPDAAPAGTLGSSLRLQGTAEGAVGPRQEGRPRRPLQLRQSAKYGHHRVPYFQGHSQIQHPYRHIAASGQDL